MDRYEEALERAKKELASCGNGRTKMLERIFPELAESEDERIRKELIEYIKDQQSSFISAPDCRDKYEEEENNKYNSWIDWLEKQGETFTKKDVDDAYLKGVTDTKNEIEKQYEATYQIRKDIATFILNYKGDIKDRAKWIDYLGIKVSFVEKQGEQKPIKEHDICDTCDEKASCVIPCPVKLVEKKLRGE